MFKTVLMQTIQAITKSGKNIIKQDTNQNFTRNGEECEYGKIQLLQRKTHISEIFSQSFNSTLSSIVFNLKPF